MKIRIYAGNLPASIDITELTELFSVYGHVYHVAVDADTARATAEIEMDPQGGQRAIAALNAQKLGQHLIRVHESLPNRHF